MRKKRIGRKTRGRLLAIALCLVLALSSTGIAVSASAAGEEQLQYLRLRQERSAHKGDRNREIGNLFS